MKACHSHNPSLNSFPRPLNLLSPEEIFNMPLQCPKDDALLSLQVYALAYCIFSGDFRDPLGTASLDLLKECAIHFSRGRPFFMPNSRA
jgi:hypothetical protein